MGSTRVNPNVFVFVVGVLTGFIISRLFNKISVNHQSLSPQVKSSFYIENDASLSDDANVQETDYDDRMRRQHLNAILLARQQFAEKASLKQLKVCALPQVDCVAKIRVGDYGDGGKWLCNPWRVPSTCVIFSMGLKNDTTFEEQLQVLLKGRCKVYGFDIKIISKQYAEVANGEAFAYKIVAKSRPDKLEYSVQDLMARFGHRRIDILKMDIEGSEITVIPSLLIGVTPNTTIYNIFACQILLEVHDGKSNGKWYRGLLKEMEKAGFWIFNIEDNPWCQNCVEASFIHESCRSAYGVSDRFLYNFMH